MIGREELLAQHVAGVAGKDVGVGLKFATGGHREQLADLLERLVDGGRDDVEGALVGELHDELAEVGLDDLRAGRLERPVQADLLGDHRLRLHDELNAMLAGKSDDVAARLGASAAKKTWPPTLSTLFANCST